MHFSVAALGFLAGTAIAAPTRNATTKPQSAVSKITLPPEVNATFGHLPTQQASDIQYRYRYHFEGSVFDPHGHYWPSQLTLTDIRGNTTEQAKPHPSRLDLSEEPQRINMQR